MGIKSNGCVYPHVSYTAYLRDAKNHHSPIQAFDMSLHKTRVNNVDIPPTCDLWEGRDYNATVPVLFCGIYKTFLYILMVL